MLPKDQLLNWTQKTVCTSASCRRKRCNTKKTIKLTNPLINYGLLTCYIYHYGLLTCFILLHESKFTGILLHEAKEALGIHPTQLNKQNAVPCFHNTILFRFLIKRQQDTCHWNFLQISQYWISMGKFLSTVQSQGIKYENQIWVMEFHYLYKEPSVALH